MEHDFLHKRKIYNFDSYIMLVIATNIPMLLMTAFVHQSLSLSLSLSQHNTTHASEFVCALSLCEFTVVCV